MPEVYIRSLRWRHNGNDGVSNHQPHHCLLNHLFGCRSKKTSKLRVTGLCAGNSLGTCEFPAQMASNAENVSIWWRHHVLKLVMSQADEFFQPPMTWILEFMSTEFPSIVFNICDRNERIYCLTHSFICNIHNGNKNAHLVQQAVALPYHWYTNWWLDAFRYRKEKILKPSFITA